MSRRAPGPETTRRPFLLGASTVGMIVVAGCTTLVGDDQSVTEDPPEITRHDYQVGHNGTRLAVELDAEAEIELDVAEITYGERAVERQPDDRRISLRSHLENVHTTGDEGEAIVYRIADIRGNEAVTEVVPNSRPPTVTVEARPSHGAGEVELVLEAEDEHGLKALEALLHEETILEHGADIVGGKATYRVEERVNVGAVTGVDLGRVNAITGTVTDWNGNGASATSETYVRKFDPAVEQRVNVGAFYLYFFDDPEMWEECTDAVPAVGRYSMRDSEAVSWHVDLMQGHGVTRLVFQADHPDNASDFLERLDEPLPATMPIEIKFTWVAPVLDWRGDRSVGEMFDWITSYFRENFLERETYVHRNGRPVVTIWDANHPVAVDDEVSDFVADELGGYEDFVRYLREQFSVDAEPYLVGMAMNLHTIGPNVPEEIRTAMTHYDALTHWFGIDAVRHERGLDPGEPTRWSDVKDYHETYYPVAREFVDNHDMEFIPTVFFGFDDRSNDCWGADRYLPRDPSHLQEMLELADEYRTSDRINVATFNDWPEAHAIEPGITRGEAHGTEYLELIEEFVT